MTKKEVRRLATRSKVDPSITFLTILFNDGTVECTCGTWKVTVPEDENQYTRNCRHARAIIAMQKSAAIVPANKAPIIVQPTQDGETLSRKGRKFNFD